MKYALAPLMATMPFFPALLRITLCAFPLTFIGCDETGSDGAKTLKINGSTTVNLPVAEAADILRKRDGTRIQVDTQGGSSGGISMLAEGRVDLGMSSKAISEKDHKNFPEVDFQPHQIGADAVALIVSADVWQGGVRSISQEEMRSIYEGRISNWSELGGPDQRVVFFNKEPGRGTWEVFAKWLYGKADSAPAVSFPEVGGNEETRSKVSSTRGALSQLSASWVDGATVYALSLRGSDGRVIEPSADEIVSGNYPMSRPLYLLSDGEPKGEAKQFINFMISEEGQELVRKHGYLGLSELGLIQ